MTVDAPVAADTARPPRRNSRRGEPWLDWMTLPALVILAVVIAYPIIRTVLTSFYDYPLFNPEHSFIGVRNYHRLASDTVFWQALRNTVVYTAASVLGAMLIGLTLALVTERLRGPWRVLRGALLTPWAVPVIVVGFLFRFMFDEQGGVVDAVLLRTHTTGTAVPWLTGGYWPMISVVIANIWSQAPFFLMVFTAALGAIPPEVVEAARIDRAGGWTLIRRIKLPYLRDAALVGTLLMVIQNFNNFPLIWTMTGGGPAYGTTTLVVYVYRLAFTSYDLGYSSTVGAVWLVLLLAVAVVFVRVLRRRSA
ncbi:carbohydrate ABC transporter permease [Peterkaempfera griseoplana]|uniref:carbohydrate ABC transporter permease n=1 Tax=Peterkaempfera griseoplana TaxID=66896 RepID=UPI0006E1293D|nr:sugar ABC transporter permease [Peterkaempfera griseoplana]